MLGHTLSLSRTVERSSVSSIIVTPHFIVSNGNGVVTGETVIRLITRYCKRTPLVTQFIPLFPSLAMTFVEKCCTD